MADQQFRVQQIDHVEVFVPDRYKAAEWYQSIFGMEILNSHKDWAVEGGPLMISSDGGNTMIALFTGKPQGGGEVTGIRRIAFRVDAGGFLAFLNRLDNTPVYNQITEKHSLFISVIHMETHMK